MPKIKETIEVRDCVGTETHLYEVANYPYKTDELGSQADQFIALGKFLRENPGAQVAGVNIGYMSDGGLYLTATITDLPRDLENKRQINTIYEGKK